MSEWIDLCSTEDLPPGSQKVVSLPEADEHAVVVFRLNDGSLRALRDCCSHADAPLSGGWIEDGCIVCPLHGAQFDLATGEACSLPATEPVQTFAVREQDGRILLRKTPDPVSSSGRTAL